MYALLKVFDTQAQCDYPQTHEDCYYSLAQFPWLTSLLNRPHDHLKRTLLRDRKGIR